ncbi:ATP-binding protein [Bifidobacterium pullorum]|uniref:ATP-binding protein n=1 Tax=Bifidobacterium pullorum TaxID=78448 RepID=UPI0009DDF3E3|nr:ATP-binding protein [Bifidobacterium pullorum]
MLAARGPAVPPRPICAIDLVEKRGLDRGRIASLDTGGCLDRRLNVVFQETTEAGKSHLLCALAKSACRHRYRAVCVRMCVLASLCPQCEVVTKCWTPWAGRRVVPDVLRKSRGPVVGGRFQSVDCMMPSSRDMSR